MSKPNTPHRPLMAGTNVNGGTLTAIATLNDGETPVLGTNLHAMVSIAGMWDVDDLAPVFQPAGSSADRVGMIFDWIPASTTEDNIGDFGIATLDEGITASYEIHNEGHDLGVLLAGVEEPGKDTPLIMVGVGTGVRPVRVLRTGSREIVHTQFGGAGKSAEVAYTGVVVVDDLGTPMVETDSGATILYASAPGVYQLAAIAFAGIPEKGEIWAMPASVAEHELDITFGYRGHTDTLSARRVIIDDYFVAGEPLSAGDVVGVREDPSRPNKPSVFKVIGKTASHSVIGVVHTPAHKVIGDLIASKAHLVPVVVHGLAKSMSASPIGVGDPVTPDSSLQARPDKEPVARVKKATWTDEPILGRSVTNATGPGQDIELLIDAAGTALSLGNQ